LPLKSPPFLGIWERVAKCGPDATKVVKGPRRRPWINSSESENLAFCGVLPDDLSGIEHLERKDTTMTQEQKRELTIILNRIIRLGGIDEMSDPEDLYETIRKMERLADQAIDVINP
jgi:hypothetical protein